MSELVIDASAIDRALRGRDGIVAHDLIRRAIKVESAAKVNASGSPGPSVRTGRLRSSIHWELRTEGDVLFAAIGTDVPYARYVEEGTGPHQIRPRRKQALYWRGARHPVARVSHPGTRARPFLVPALRAALG